MIDIDQELAQLHALVAEKTSELQEAQRRLVILEGRRRRMELEAMSRALPGQGVGVTSQPAPSLAANGGFPTSRSDIQAQQSIPTMLNGTAGSEMPGVAFQLPAWLTAEQSPEVLPLGGSKGPEMVRLF